MKLLTVLISLCIVHASLAQVPMTESTSIQLGNGTMVLSDVEFIRVGEFDNYKPELIVTVRNETKLAWTKVRFQLDIGGICDGKPTQWTLPVTVINRRWRDKPPIERVYRDMPLVHIGKVDHCTAFLYVGRLLLAENQQKQIDNKVLTPVDMVPALQATLDRWQANPSSRAADIGAITASRDAAGSRREEIENRRIAEEKELEAAENARKAKEDAQFEAARRAAAAKAEAARQAAAAEQLRKARANCAAIYRLTIDKKQGDLTVRETEQIQGCRALGMYPPR